MVSLFRRAARVVAMVLAATCLTSCEQSFFAKTAAPVPGGIALSLSLPATSAGDARAAFDKADHIRVVVTAGSTVLRDTTIAFTTADVSHLRIELPAAQDGQTATVTATVLRGTQALFTASGTVVLKTGQAATLDTTLQPVATALQIGGSAVTLTAIGDAVTPTVVALFATGDTIPSPSIQWSSSNAGIVSVNATTGRILAVAEGTAQITARIGTSTLSFPAVVNATVQSVTVANPLDTLSVGASRIFTATARDRNNNVLNRTFAYISSNLAIAGVIGTTGQVTGVSPGQATISATAGGVTGTAPVTVIASGSTLTGTVVNSSNNAPISGATVTAQGVSGAARVATTGTNGAFTFTNLPAGQFSITVQAPGFVTLQVNQQVNAGTNTRVFALSSTAGGGAWRIVLTWGSTPLDLDSHLLMSGTTNFEVDYSTRGSATSSPFATLDVDDQDAFGPETITIVQEVTGTTYTYFVDNFSQTGTFSQSLASIDVYKQGVFFQRFTPPAGGGNTWTVFRISNGTLTQVNQVTPEAPPGTSETGVTPLMLRKLKKQVQ